MTMFLILFGTALALSIVGTAHLMCRSTADEAPLAQVFWPTDGGDRGEF